MLFQKIIFLSEPEQQFTRYERIKYQKITGTAEI